MLCARGPGGVGAESALQPRSSYRTWTTRRETRADTHLTGSFLRTQQPRTGSHVVEAAEGILPLFFGRRVDMTVLKFQPSMNPAGDFPVSECGVECCLNRKRETVRNMVLCLCFRNADFSSRIIRSALALLDGWYGAVYVVHSISNTIYTI